MAIIVPNTGSTFASAACVVGSEDKWCFFGFRTLPNASGSATFYRTASPTSGCEILSISLSPGQATVIPQAFNSPCGVYINGVSGGCAIVWMKEKQ